MLGNRDGRAREVRQACRWDSGGKVGLGSIDRYKNPCLWLRTPTMVGQSQGLVFRPFLPILHMRNLKHRESFSLKSPWIEDSFTLKPRSSFTLLFCLWKVLSTIVTWISAEGKSVHHSSLVLCPMGETDAAVTPHYVIDAMRGERGALNRDAWLSWE